MKYYYILFSVLILLVSSCEKYLDFDDEIKTSKLVINGVINPDSTFRVEISNSLSVIDKGDLEPVENAVVNIFDGSGALYETLIHDSDGYYLGSLKPLDNQQYTVEVSAPNFSSIRAQTSIPLLTSISSVDTLGVEDVDQYKELRLTIRFDDAANKVNYYRLEVFAADEINGEIFMGPLSMRSDDVTLGLEQGGYSHQINFSDELFDGQSVTLVVYVPDTRDYDDFLEIRLSSFSEELYRYSKTYAAYQNTFGNPFAQPVQVSNNVEGGFGLFAGYQLSRKKIAF